MQVRSLAYDVTGQFSPVFHSFNNLWCNLGMLNKVTVHYAIPNDLN